MNFKTDIIFNLITMSFCIILYSPCSSNILVHAGKYPLKTLGKLIRNADLVNFTISGFSAGGAQAMQFHFAHSSRVHGVGIFSGVPYLYGLDRKREDFYVNDPKSMNMSKTEAHINSSIARGLIDPPEFLSRSPVYVHHGTRDTIVNPGSAEMIEKIYNKYNVYPNKQITESEHGMPTDNDHSGGPCGTLNLISGLVNNCQYKGVFDMFNYLYGGNLRKPVGNVPLKGEFVEFDQTQFFDDGNPRAASMDSVGYAYIPSECIETNRTCRLSFALHGCIQSRQSYGDKFARTTGYLETAELNDIVLVFPQAKPYMMKPKNPSGCWDWWGFTGEGYATKDGKQITALKRMMDRMLVV